MTLTWEQRTANTAAAFDDPRPGDRFQEVFAFWVMVLAVDEYGITVRQGHPRGELVARHFATADEYRAAYSYDSQSGYWVTLDERGEPA